MIAEKLAEVEFETLTPSLLGGYDTGSYSYVLGKDFYEVPRPLAIKGCLRWWLRVLLAGALWEAGKSEEEIEKRVGEKVGWIFGTTYPPRSSSASQILLHIQMLNPSSLEEVQDSIPRMKLLTQGSEYNPKKPSYKKDKREWRLSCFREGLKFKLFLYLRPNSKLGESEKEVALWATALYSIFGGIGAMTRRGFGALQLEKEPSFLEGTTLSKFVDYNQVTSNLVRKAVEEALESAHKLFGTSWKERREIPSFPVLARSDVFKTEIREIKKKDPISLLVKLGECTLKETWKNREKRGYRYDTWILGLPRGMGNTGYTPKKRRASAICLKPLARNEEDWKVLVYGFLSRDWPKIEHHSALKSQLVKTTPEEAFRKAWEKVLSLLR
ncbi:MAG: type III-B CRISPR module RAMP protein Cmr1 [Candidatus Hadarchaeales archaeon]